MNALGLLSAPGTNLVPMVMSGEKRLNGPRCSAVPKRGTKCEALARADGLCSAHSGTAYMRELGSKAARVAAAEPVSASPSRNEGLVEALRGLDVKLVKATAEELLQARTNAKELLLRTHS